MQNKCGESGCDKTNGIRLCKCPSHRPVALGAAQTGKTSTVNANIGPLSLTRRMDANESVVSECLQIRYCLLAQSELKVIAAEIASLWSALPNHSSVCSSGNFEWVMQVASEQTVHLQSREYWPHSQDMLAWKVLLFHQVSYETKSLWIIHFVIFRWFVTQVFQRLSICQTPEMYFEEIHSERVKLGW